MGKTSSGDSFLLNAILFVKKYSGKKNDRHRFFRDPQIRIFNFSL